VHDNHWKIIGVNQTSFGC